MHPFTSPWLPCLARIWLVAGIIRKVLFGLARADRLRYIYLNFFLSWGGRPPRLPRFSCTFSSSLYDLSPHLLGICRIYPNLSQSTRLREKATTGYASPWTKMSQLGGLSGEGFQRPTSTGRKGRTLLKNKLVPSANPTSAISNSEDGIERAIDESAIDDDAEQWEDDPARDNADESKLQFKRRDLPANRPSCSPSLLTLIMEQSTPALSRPGEGLDRPSSVVSPEDPTDRRRRKTNHAPPMRPINKRFCTITDDARTRLNIIDAELTRELMENLLRLRAFPKHVIKEGKDQDDSIWDQYSDPKSW